MEVRNLLFHAEDQQDIAWHLSREPITGADKKIALVGDRSRTTGNRTAACFISAFLFVLSFDRNAGLPS